MSTGPRLIDRDSGASPVGGVRLLPLSVVAAIALLSGVFLLASVFPLFYSDVWGHLKFGEWIVAHRALPEKDPFCPFTEPQPVGLHLYWLSQSGMYLLYHFGEFLAGGDHFRRTAGGVELLRGAHVLAVLLRFGLLLFAFRRRTGSLDLACLGILIVLVNSLLPFGVQRPQVAGELFFACLLLALSRPVLSRQALFLIPVCLILWANMHGSFLIGLVLLGAYLAGRLVEAFFSPSPLRGGGWGEGSLPPFSPSPLRGEGTEEEWLLGTEKGWLLPRFRQMMRDSQARRLAVVLLASLAGITLLNPDGVAIWGNVLGMARHPNLPTMLEWEPLSFTRQLGWHWCYLALVALTAGTFLFSRKLPSPTQFILIAGFGAMPLLQQRMMLWWVMAGPWAMSANWPIVRGRWFPAETPEGLSPPEEEKADEAPSPVPEEEEKTEPARVASGLLPWLLAGAVVLGALAISPSTVWLRTGAPAPLEESLFAATPWQVAAQLDAGPDEPPVLDALARGLRDHYPNGRYTGYIFASETTGEYLLWTQTPARPVLVYTHVHLFSYPYWQQCRAVKAGCQGWETFLNNYHVNLIVVEAERYATFCRAVAADPNWLVVVDETGSKAKRDPKTRLFVALRKKPHAA